MDRRAFLQAASQMGFGALVASGTAAWALETIANPLAQYPNRGWEKAYRDLFAVDDSFVFLCAPNDTHNCLLRAYVRNGVVTRIGPTMGYGEATDLLGNKSSHRWDPRCCQKGLALTRRFYGDRRVRQPADLQGWRVGRQGLPARRRRSPTGRVTCRGGWLGDRHLGRSDRHGRAGDEEHRRNLLG
ncbi:MAG: hypothetical protein U0Q55_17485 [Vicinamibacterales bacterium]